MNILLLFLLITLSTTVNGEVSLQDIDITITQEQCIKRSKSVMKSIGATELDILHFEHVLSVNFKKHHYFVICRADKGLAVAAEETKHSVSGKFVTLIAEALLN